LLAIALSTILVHLLAGGRYGFHRDELATLDDARHLAWGYVAYPPVTPFFGRLSLILFGPSIIGFRFFAICAQALAVFITGLVARELGGSLPAQLLAAAAAIPFNLAGGALMQYVSFDYLAWILTAYSVLRLLKTREPRWWLAVGGAIGFGMMSKYSMVFLVGGLAVGILVSDARRLLLNRWLWFGVAVSLIIFLPNLLWQIRHDFISVEFLRTIHERDVQIGRTKDFLPDQIKMTLFTTPLAIAGLYFYLVSAQGRRFRALAWMYIVPLLLFVFTKGRGYYMAATYPVLYAAGAVAMERWLANFRRSQSRLVWFFAGTTVAANIVLAGLVALPIAPVNSSWWNFAAKANGDLVEQIGWPELVATVAHIRDSLPPSERSRFGILAANYGEAGAINLYGPAHGLPIAISGINSFYDRGYPDPPPNTLILLGFSQQFMERNFEACWVAGKSTNPYGVQNEESRDHPDISVCRGLRPTWPDFWKDRRRFG
jgi:4-amino-4-deoxy-L-arabinose transferase-like glycosyltransferase